MISFILTDINNRHISSQNSNHNKIFRLKFSDQTSRDISQNETKPSSERTNYMIWFNLMMILYLSDSLRGDLSYCHNATLEITLRVASFFGILKDGVECKNDHPEIIFSLLLNEKLHKKIRRSKNP